VMNPEYGRPHSSGSESGPPACVFQRTIWRPRSRGRTAKRALDGFQKSMAWPSGA
jgi:hypothetical protein